MMTKIGPREGEKKDMAQTNFLFVHVFTGNKYMRKETREHKRMKVKKNCKNLYICTIKHFYLCYKR